LELVIVVVIIGIIAAIAIPRMSRGTAGASDSALTGDLAVLRNALDLFAAEHDGKFPTLAKIDLQLTQYTDSAITSDPVATKDATHVYGPYVRAVPKLPVGANKGLTAFTNAAIGTTAAGWWYNEATGEIKANTADTETDSPGGTKYSEY
jgi:type II secretory pathway pseudopilin PulG